MRLINSFLQRDNSLTTLTRAKMDRDLPSLVAQQSNKGTDLQFVDTLCITGR
jgi:hypothetical protein